MVDKKTLGDVAAKAVRIIPGIGAYQDKETRRSLDKQLREHLAAVLNRERDRVNDVKIHFTERLQFDPLDDLDRISRRMYQLADTITFASYGWSPLFDEASADEHHLENLYLFDKSLEDALAEVQGMVDALTANADNGLDTALTELHRSLSNLEDTLRKRDQLLKPV